MARAGLGVPCATARIRTILTTRVAVIDRAASRASPPLAHCERQALGGQAAQSGQTLVERVNVSTMRHSRPGHSAL
jgi:hypothetical protein